jgi:hypothetical protein
MSIDFLDRLEADLREAAERRGQPSPRRRRPRPGPALKALAVAAVLALLVVGGARLANDDPTERPATTPTPTPTPPPAVALFVNGPVKTAVATTGDASSLDVLVQRLADAPDLKFILPRNGRPALADPSLGTVVLYRGDDAKDVATFVARGAGIERVRPLTDADEQKISFDVSRARLVIVFGTDLQDAQLAESQECTSGGTVSGGALSVCLVTRDGSTLSGLFVNGERLPVAQMTERGQWRWAAASPDGETILAQWSGECEVPQAFLLDADGGSPRAVAPKNAESEALGWTTDGQAIVFLPNQPACGTEWKPGMYLVSADGKQRTRVPGVIGTEPPLEPSIRPRDVGEAYAVPAP